MNESQITKLLDILKMMEYQARVFGQDHRSIREIYDIVNDMTPVDG